MYDDKTSILPARHLGAIERSEGAKNLVTYGGDSLSAFGNNYLEASPPCEASQKINDSGQFPQGAPRSVHVNATRYALEQMFDSIISIDTREKIGPIIDFCSSLRQDEGGEASPEAKRFLPGIDDRSGWQPYMARGPAKGRPGLQGGILRDEIKLITFRPFGGKNRGPEVWENPGAALSPGPLSAKNSLYLDETRTRQLGGPGHSTADMADIERKSIEQRREQAAGRLALLEGNAYIFSMARDMNLRPPSLQGRQNGGIEDGLDIRKDCEKGSEGAIGMIQSRKGRFDEEGSQSGSRERKYDEGHVDVRSGLQKPRIALSEERAVSQLKMDTLELEKALTQQVMQKEEEEETAQAAASQKEMPVKHAREAARHAATSIESVIKKSQSETWSGDEIAAKLIYLLMKASSTFTFEHSSRVIDLSIELAREMGITDEAHLKEIEEGAMFHDIGEVELDLEDAPPQTQARLAKYIGVMDLKNCSFLHDIGKVKIPDSILYKPGRLTDEEFMVLKQHPVIGEAILKPLPSMQHVLPVVRHHHEKWDGSGYPDGLIGEAIPMSARIVGLADAYDAMVSDRPYRKGMPVEEAIAEMKRCAGTHFDPSLVKAFLRVLERENGKAWIS
jgi:HD-GYP domain-containing protein (c-di-GMP phosphodiesterase class II)